MLGNTFSHDTIRKYVVLFGTLFNEIYLTREDEQGNKIETTKVPLSYAPKDKMLARVFGDPDIDRKVAITLPRMSFELVNMTYDSSRKFSKIGKTGRTVDGEYVYNPVPFNLDFELNIMVKNSEDGTTIIQQILPYFTPDWTVSANLIPGISSKVDVPIVYTGISKEDSYDGDYKQRRAIIWTLSFTLKGYLFGPVNNKAKIETAIVNIFDDNKDPAYKAVTITTTEDGVNIEEF